MPAVDRRARRVACRLLGGGHELEERLEASTPQQAAAWVAAAKYLEGRLQSTHEQCPGRERDMSPAAADAMIAVMRDATESASAWLSLRSLIAVDSRGVAADGAAAAHPHGARLEAARKLIGNHSVRAIPALEATSLLVPPLPFTTPPLPAPAQNVVRDLCNPSVDTNIHGRPLTQLELQRVPVEDARFADQLCREVARRLLGRRDGSHELEERLDPSIPRQADVWAASAEYLIGRIQSRGEEMPGREPDMSGAAAAAMTAVLIEVRACACADACARTCACACYDGGAHRGPQPSSPTPTQPRLDVPTPTPGSIC